LHRSLAGTDVDIAGVAVADVVASDGCVQWDAAQPNAQPGQARNVIVLDRRILGAADQDGVLDAAAPDRRALGLDRAVSNHVVAGTAIGDIHQHRLRRRSFPGVIGQVERIDVAKGEPIDDDVAFRAAGTIERSAEGYDAALAGLASEHHRFTRVIHVRDRGPRRSRLVRLQDLVVRPGPDVNRISCFERGIGFADRGPRRRYRRTRAGIAARRLINVIRRRSGLADEQKTHHRRRGDPAGTMIRFRRTAHQTTNQTTCHTTYSIHYYY
jgi:hypothetical protein